MVDPVARVGPSPAPRTPGPEPVYPLRDPTCLSSWGLAIAKALESRGIDPAVLFARAGLDFEAIDIPEARYATRTVARLWALAVEATGDPCFGIEVARHTSATTFHALGLSLAASGSVREALDRVVRYYRLFSDGATIRLEDRGDCYRVALRTEARPELAAREPLDAVLAVAVRLCRSLVGRSFSPLRVELRRPAPRDASPFARYFRSPVVFDADEDALILDKELCDRRIRGANPELARTNDLVAARAIERYSRSRMSDRARTLLIERLPGGAPLQAEIARSLGTSVRALQRSLVAESTTYVQLLEETRRELADAHLREGRSSMTEIAYLLGFSGVAPFTRAFRRWTGKAPTEFRRQARGKTRQI